MLQNARPAAGRFRASAADPFHVHGAGHPQQRGMHGQDHRHRRRRSLPVGLQHQRNAEHDRIAENCAHGDRRCVGGRPAKKIFRQHCGQQPDRPRRTEEGGEHAERRHRSEFGICDGAKKDRRQSDRECEITDPARSLPATASAPREIADADEAEHRGDDREQGQHRKPRCEAGKRGVSTRFHLKPSSKRIVRSSRP